MIKNKRGDIPVTILVLGTFAICALALLSFYASSVSIGKSFVGIDLMEKMDSKINEYNFYKSKGFSDERIEEIFSVEENFYFEEDYFEINKTSKKSFWSDEEFLFSSRYFLPKS